MKIIVGLDGSAPCRAAIEEVANRVWPKDATIRVLSAVPVLPQIPVVPNSNMPGPTGDDDGMEAQLKETSEEFAQLLRDKGLTVETAVREGDLPAVIVDEAKEWSADLIVVASHGRSGIERLLLGSVSQQVVSRAPCSVEIVRPKIKT